MLSLPLSPSPRGPSSQPPPRQPILRAALTGLGLALLFTVLEITEGFIKLPAYRTRDSLLRQFAGTFPPWIIAMGLVPVILWLVRRAPLTRQTWVAAAVVHLPAACLFPIVHYSLLCGLHALTIGLGDPFSVALRVLLSEYGLRDLIFYAGVAALAQVRITREAQRALQLAEARLRADQAEAQARAIVAQLNPHFLYNSLNTVSMLVRQGLETEALEAIAILGELLQRLLHEEAGADAPLSEELAFVEQYLSMEGIRFADRLRVELIIAPEARGVPVPRFILQPLVENAVKHGLGATLGEGCIWIRAELEGGSLRLLVEDDGPGPPATGGEPSGGAGLRIVAARLAQRYGGQGRFRLSPRWGGGTSAELRLPISRPA